MFHKLSIITIIFTFVNAVPIDNSKTVTEDIIEDNIINVDEQPEKQVQYVVISIVTSSNLIYRLNLTSLQSLWEVKLQLIISFLTEKD